jgi:hypothetical protein
MAGDQYDEEKWVPDDALSSLAMEEEVHGEESHETRAKRLLTENVDVAATSIIWIAKNDSNSRMRFEAGKYIMERVLGRAGDSPATGTLDDLFDKLDQLNAQAAAQEQATISPGSSTSGSSDPDAA